MPTLTHTQVSICRLDVWSIDWLMIMMIDDDDDDDDDGDDDDDDDNADGDDNGDDTATSCLCFLHFYVLVGTFT